MRQSFLSGCVLGAALVLTAACGTADVPAATSRAVARVTDILLASDSDFIVGNVPQGRTLGTLLSDYDVIPEDRVALVSAVEQVFDVRRMRVGQPYAVDRMLDGRLRSFEYEIDGDRRLVVQSDDDNAFEASIETIPKDVSVDAVEGEISRLTPSLTQALDAAGERIDLALQMADIFSGELDFSSELQPGDEFRLVVERYTRDGEFAGYGPILAAEFVASGRSLRAYRYTPEGAKPAYFDEDGRSLKRFFLKSPLKFEPRITSRFSSARRHPVLGYARPQRRGLLGPAWCARRHGGARHGHAGRLDQRWRPDRARPAQQRLREPVSAPVGHHRAARPARVAGRAGRQGRIDGARHGPAPALRPPPQRAVRQSRGRASQHAPG
ncbi:MAG: hypothetical protein R2712_19955 [Vicinamibacterales bacterium]